MPDSESKSSDAICWGERSIGTPSLSCANLIACSQLAALYIYIKRDNGSVVKHKSITRYNTGKLQEVHPTSNCFSIQLDKTLFEFRKHKSAKLRYAKLEIL